MRLAAIACVAALSPPAHAAEIVPMDADTASTLVQVLDGGQHPSLAWSDIRDVVPSLRQLYANEVDGLFWFENGQPVPALAGALEALVRSGDRGLEPTDYDADKLAASLKALQAAPPSAPERALFDLAVSADVLRVMGAVRHGRVDPRTLAFDYDIAPRRLDAVATLREARDGRGVAAALDALEPPFQHYARAKAALRVYRGLAAQGDVAPVPTLPKGQTKVERGKAWPGVPALRARLTQLGDLRADAATGDVYDDSLFDAVKRFQVRHVIDADGVVGKGTIEALNVPVRDRERQIELAMERMRWLPEMAGRPVIFVNVALYRLWATDTARTPEPLRLRGRGPGPRSPHAAVR